MQQQNTKLKILCISDTHAQTHKTKIFQQEGHIFICAGDFTVYSKQQQIYQFCDILAKLKFKHKIVICGNHQVHFDSLLDPQSKRKKQNPTQKTPQFFKQLISKYCIYLEHQLITIQGIRIFGSPYAIRHGSTAFGYEKDQAQKIWSTLPTQIDILITHGPPKGILDKGKKQDIQLGCPQLRKKIFQIKPKIHIFGHIHESSGVKLIQNITFINASQCGSKRRLVNKPYVFFLQKK